MNGPVTAEHVADELPAGELTADAAAQDAAQVAGQASDAADSGAGGELSAVHGAESAADAAASGGEEPALVVTIGDEHPPEDDERSAAPWIKELRKQNRELVRRTRHLEQQLQQQQPAPAAVVVGPKPTMAACDYDEDKFASEMEAWHGRKAKADEQQREAQRQQETQAADWQKRLQNYRSQAAALRVPGFEQAEETVRDTFSVVQQGLLIRACKQPALMVAALGNNERKARDLAAITDPVEFVAEVARLEAQVKTQARKPAAPVERMPPRSSTAGAAAVDNQLAKLQAEADRTGDRTKVVAYMRGKQVQAA